MHIHSISHKAYIRLALPFTLSTVTQPLLGAVDTAVVGRLDNPSFIGGVAIGTVIFNTLYWLFGFLRVATSGFAAQSLGQKKLEPGVHAWLRPLIIAAGIGLLFICCQKPILQGALLIYDAEPDVTVHAVRYFRILIWGAPMVLISYVNLGWLMGRGHVRQVMLLQIGTNMLNILLDTLFVLYFHMGVAGVATATLISQASGLFLGILLISPQLPLNTIKKYSKGLLEASAMKKLASVNSDLLIRTVCLLTMTNIFVARGSSMGTDILAANAILFQLQYLIAYFFDGLANAASVFAGKFVGSGDLTAFAQTRSIAHLNLIGLVFILVAGLLLLDLPLIRIFTNIEPVVTLCEQYLFYILLFLLTMPLGLVYAGFYIGATCSAPIRNSLILSLLFFLLMENLLIPKWGNHGLWTAFIVFCAVRSAVLYFSWHQLTRHAFKAVQPSSC
ncbi:MATE family efflux transporter [Desulfogranum japonicum]|uniref:MATE family efflux transporter n=1 Tax=Desulfogranum japonicum TaxID=231447 RepID=UPI0003FE508F|nr:MATE family efflux transporter [Desulfogranum japonicum]